MSDQIDYDDLAPDRGLGEAVDFLFQRIRFGLKWRKVYYLKCRTRRTEAVTERDDVLLLVFCDRWRWHRGSHRDR